MRSKTSVGAPEAPEVKGRYSVFRRQGAEKTPRIKQSKLLMSASLALLALVCIIPTSIDCEHALSEVWSENEGVKMKYSTDHDDLLSTKGSEMSLSTSHQHTPAKEHEEEAAGEAEGAASVKTNSGETAPVSEETSGSEKEDKEERADSSRQTDKIPLGGSASARQYSSASKQQHFIQKFSDPPQRYQSNGESDDEQQSSGRQSESKSSSGEPEMLSFNSALEQTGSEDQSSADHGDDESSSRAAESAGKFRSPGRLFKEAIRQTSQSDQSSRNIDESNGEDKDRNSQEERASADHGSGRDEVKDNQSPQSDGSDGDNDEERAEPKQTRNENMIDFESGQQASGKQQMSYLRDQADQEVQLLGGQMRNGGFQPMGRGLANADEDEIDGYFRPRNNAFASAAAGSTAHKERSIPVAPVASKQKSAPVYRSNSAGAGINNKPAQQLTYFRGQQKLNQASSVAPPESPDSVRDNFISPGHFPGSMPHLTQAASETQRKQLEADKVAVEAAASPSASGAASSIPEPEAGATIAQANSVSLPNAQGSSSQQLVASDTIFGPVQLVDNRVAVVPSQLGLGNSTVVRVQVIEVTPVPDALPESQQIMAPTLLSTTTMAPMPALTQAANPSNGTNGTNTTAVPSLKRFKSRKYNR